MPPATATTTPFAPGVFLVLGEQDYCYGLGTLTLRLEQLGADPRSLSKLEWVRVVGREIHPDGTAGAERDIMARVAALPRAKRPADWQPPQR